MLVDFLLEVAVSEFCWAESEPETALFDALGRTLDLDAAECPVDFDGAPADELLDVDGPFGPAEPVASAEATAGIDAIAAPTPNATADAPSHVNACELASAARPNSTRFNCILVARPL
ncbi:hypothetical protein [Mycolicibacterium pallens]|uniref:hypothetical protein n=1 Tax=Mycolicibacterium pallens TaxID=370524 RepID=UPI0031DB7A52